MKKARITCYDYQDEKKFYELEISNGLWYKKLANSRGDHRGWYWSEIYTYLSEHEISTENIKEKCANRSDKNASNPCSLQNICLLHKMPVD